MSHFRRVRSGPSYFFTLVAYHRRPILCDDAIRATLHVAFDRVRNRLPFDIDAIVLMPDHLHCIWTLPDGDFDVSNRWAQIKHHVSYTCRDAYDGYISTGTRRRRGESAIWQRRFWEHQIRDEHDMERHVDYIHYNPVKHGFAASAAEWPYSSFGRYVKRGVYPMDWGGTDAARGMMLEYCGGWLNAWTAEPSTLRGGCGARGRGAKGAARRRQRGGCGAGRAVAVLRWCEDLRSGAAVADAARDRRRR